MGTPIAMMVRNQEKRTTDLPCDLYHYGLGSRVSEVRVEELRCRDRGRCKAERCTGHSGLPDLEEGRVSVGC